MTAPHPDPEELMASLDSEVPAERTREIRAHLDACASCAALVGQLREPAAALAEWAVEAPPAALSARVRDVALRPRDSAASASSWRAGRARWAVLAAMVLIGITIPLRMQCVEASSACQFDRVRYLLGTAGSPAESRQPDSRGTAGRDAGIAGANPEPLPPASGGGRNAANASGALPGAAPLRQSASAGEAKVVVTMFIDWQCPACRAAHESYSAVFQQFEQLSPGEVTLVVKDFPLNSACNPAVSSKPHATACEAAVAVRLARQKGREHEMIEWLFANQAGLTPDSVKAALSSITGTNDFDLHYAEEVEHVRSDAAEGVGLHVQFTPSCFLNGVLTNRPDGGWLPAEELRTLIERELMKAPR